MTDSISGAILGGAALGAGAQVIGALSGASKQREARDQANNMLFQQLSQYRNLLGPYLEGGTAAMGKYRELLGTAPSPDVQAALESIPGYQFTREQGIRGVTQANAARGLTDSGAVMREIARYTTGLANTTYGDQVNRLLQATTLGQNAAAGLGTAGVQAGIAGGNNIVNAGNATAAANMAIANALGTVGAAIPSALITPRFLAAAEKQGERPTSTANVYNRPIGQSPLADLPPELLLQLFMQNPQMGF